MWEAGRWVEEGAVERGEERGERGGGEGRRGGGERGGEGREWVVDKERAAVRRDIEGKLWRCR